MQTQTIEQLNRQFGLDHKDNTLSFRNGRGDIPVIEICNRHASALISLQGAHVLSWIPLNEEGGKNEDGIWLSQDAVFAPGKSVRGGIPICWPWFGQHPDNKPGFPAHGFARTCMWQVRATGVMENGNTRIDFSLQPDEQTQAMWPPGVTVGYSVVVGHKLELELLSENTGNSTVSISDALHTYFRVGDISDVRLHGLDDTEYLDKPDNFKRKRQHGPVTVEGEVDRIYVDTAGECVIEDRSLERQIVIIKIGSHSTVVWNPGEAVAEKMGDLGHNGYRQMLCVESANAADNTVSLAPGKSHRLWVQYEVQAL